MKKFSILMIIAVSAFIFSSCKSNAFSQNHGFSNKHISTIATSKGGKIFCHH